MGKSKDIRYFAIVFIASIVVTVMFLIVLPDKFAVNESSDYTSFYEPVARNILSGKGYTRDGSTIETFYPPGYPIILATLFGLSKTLSIPESTITNLFIVITTAISATLIFHMSKKVTSARAALAAVFLWNTYPFLLWITKQPNSEIPFIAFLYGGCTIFFSAIGFSKTAKLPYLISGILIGIAILIRPIAIPFPLIFAISLLFFLSNISILRRCLLIGVFFIGVLLLIFPWESYVYIQTGKFMLVSGNGSTALRGGLVFAVDSEYKQPVSVPEDVRTMMLEIKNEYDDFNQIDQVFTFFKAKLKNTPVTVFKLFSLKAIRSWYGTDSQRYETYIKVLQLPYLILILTGSFLALIKGGGSRKICIGLWLLTLCNWGMDILVTSSLRYMLPLIRLQFINVAQVPDFIIQKLQAQHLLLNPIGKKAS